MFGFLASLLAGIGALTASTASSACIWWVHDEPKCPKSLLK